MFEMIFGGMTLSGTATAWVLGSESTALDIVRDKEW